MRVVLYFLCCVECEDLMFFRHSSCHDTHDTRYPELLVLGSVATVCRTGDVDANDPQVGGGSGLLCA